MKKLESGRTLIETLAIMAMIGILTISGLQLYAKAMNTIRANYIMEQVYVKANELVENPVASRRKIVDISIQGSEGLSYGYSFCSSSEGCKPKRDGNNIVIQVDGYFPVGLCKMLKKKIESQEYAGLEDIEANSSKLKNQKCPTDTDITSMTFIIDSEFRLRINKEKENE